MSDDTRKLCQLPVGTRIVSRSGLVFVVREIAWGDGYVRVQYQDNHQMDRIGLEAPVYYDQENLTWRMGRGE